VDVLVAIAGVAGLTWAAVLFLRGGLFAGCLAVTFSGYLFGHAFFHIDVVTLDRVLWAVLLAQFAFWWARGWVERKPWGKPEYLLLVWFAWMAVSTLTHDWTVNQQEPLGHLLFFFAMPVGLYYVARESSLTPRKVYLLLGSFMVLGVYLAVTSLAETRQWWWLVYPSYIGSMENFDYLGRGRGPLLNASGNGILQTTCLCAGLMLWPRAGRFGKLALLAYAVVMGVGLYCTYTRSVWLGAAVAVAVVLWFALPTRLRVPVFTGGVLLAVVLLVTQGQRYIAFKRDIHATANDAAESVRLRPVLAMVAWKMFRDQPLTGCGFGQYSNECGMYLGDRDTSLVLEKARPYVQHNVVLRLLSETGLPGAALFVAMLALWSVDAVRVWKNRDGPWWARQTALLFLAVLATYLVNGMFHDVSQINMMNMHVMLWAGLAAGLRPWARTQPATPLPAPPVTVTAPGSTAA
jgi:O-antigen ligase